MSLQSASSQSDFFSKFNGEKLIMLVYQLLLHLFAIQSSICASVIFPEEPTSAFNRSQDDRRSYRGNTRRNTRRPVSGRIVFESELASDINRDDNRDRNRTSRRQCAAGTTCVRLSQCHFTPQELTGNQCATGVCCPRGGSFQIPKSRKPNTNFFP